MRGEIWICNFGTNIGSEQNGIRPCLIINQKEPSENTCIVLPASHTIRSSTFTINDYHFLLHQVRVIDTRRLVRRILRISKRSVDTAVENLHDLLHV
jgi:mRNA-degrading endonuclease toxin of MazEF toxin-antitoxin module